MSNKMQFQSRHPFASSELICVCVCERNRDRESDRGRDREKQRERERERDTEYKISRGPWSLTLPLNGINMLTSPQ